MSGGVMTQIMGRFIKKITTLQFDRVPECGILPP